MKTFKQHAKDRKRMAIEERAIKEYQSATRRERFDWELCMPLLAAESSIRRAGRRRLPDRLYNAERYGYWLDTGNIIGEQNFFPEEKTNTPVEEPVEYTKEDFIKDTFTDDVITDLLER